MHGPNGVEPAVLGSIQPQPLAQDASGFTNGAYGIIYNDTYAKMRAPGFTELRSAGTASLVAGALTIDFGGAGTDILRLTPA